MRTKQGNGHKVDLQQFLEDIKVVVQDGEQLLKAGATGVKQRAVAGARTTDRAVRNYPYQTIGIAFGLGIIVGMIATSCWSSGVSEEIED